MPELPEVEVLVRHLRPLLVGQKIGTVTVRRPKTIKPDSPRSFSRQLTGARIVDLTRRGKYLVFTLKRNRARFAMIGHLGMTGRMYLAQYTEPFPKHCPVSFRLGTRVFVFEDYRYFGRLTLRNSGISRLGVEPLSRDFTDELLAKALSRTRQPIKTALMNQALVAGIGNIYASEILFRAGIRPQVRANRLTMRQVAAIRSAVVAVLTQAVESGSTIPLNSSGRRSADKLFYFGTSGPNRSRTERLLVYDRAGKPCHNCGKALRRIVQAGRSTFYCPGCQKRAG